jgi:hypothetical protein
MFSMHGRCFVQAKVTSSSPWAKRGNPSTRLHCNLSPRWPVKPANGRLSCVPKSNEQGSVIDWYSPVQGDVVPWSSATEDERNDARAQLNQFKNAIADMSSALVQAGNKGGQSDQVIFGKLLGLVPHAPADAYIYLVDATRINAAGQSERYTQPVLTFWGFVQHEGDPASRPALLESPTHCTSTCTSRTFRTCAHRTAGSAAHSSHAIFWRRFWWLWPLLLVFLALLLFGLLRGCTPSAMLPVGSVSVPHINADTDSTGPVVAAGSSNPAGAIVPSGSGSGSGTNASNVVPEPAPVAEPAETPLPESIQPSTAPPQPSSQPTAEAAPAPSVAPGTPLSIPSDAAEGPADFLNGSYRAGAGIMDAKTSRPLRLEYAFEKGQGNVTIRRPDGVTCSGAVSAAMNAGSLGLNSQDQATCTDGSRYDMPKVACKPGAQSIADCQGNYGNTQFPMSMRRE